MNTDSIAPRNLRHLSLMFSGLRKALQRGAAHLFGRKTERGTRAMNDNLRQPRADWADDSDMLDWEMRDDGPPRWHGRGDH